MNIRTKRSIKWLINRFFIDSIIVFRFNHNEISDKSIFIFSGFAMTLKLINNKIVFTPNFPDVEASLLETYDTILRGMLILMSIYDYGFWEG